MTPKEAAGELITDIRRESLDQALASACANVGNTAGGVRELEDALCEFYEMNRNSSLLLHLAQWARMKVNVLREEMVFGKVKPETLDDLDSELDMLRHVVEQTR
jgi:hypothetical protein